MDNLILFPSGADVNPVSYSFAAKDGLAAAFDVLRSAQATKAARAVEEDDKVELSSAAEARLLREQGLSAAQIAARMGLAAIEVENLLANTNAASELPGELAG